MDHTGRTPHRVVLRLLVEFGHGYQVLITNHLMEIDGSEYSGYRCGDVLPGRNASRFQCNW